MKTYFIPNTPMKILLEEVEYFKSPFSFERVVIPKSYCFDGLSIPRYLQWLVDMNKTKNILAWLIHDYEFSEISDIWFMEANKRLRRNLDCTFIAKWIIWGWVSTFWWFSYKKDSNYKLYKKEIQKARIKLNLISLT